ncbi:ABC transporter substrate-binding protein [Lachnospiraceae bacterium OttesenSCG-928-D06]|nr:ABC transporter substrate-binding protein [Lachnospiraceae bacterium OttesenSCG-928-D06]
MPQNVVYDGRKKNMRRKSLLSLLLAGVMTVTLLTGCGKGDENTAVSQTSTQNAAGNVSEEKSEEPISVKLVMFGEESPRMKELMANEIYDKVLEEINVDLKIQYLPWTEYAGGKSELMFSAGEKFFCYTNTEVTAKMVGKGYYADLTGVLPENAPELYEYCDAENMTKAFTIDGKIYSLPVGYKPNAGEDYLMMVRRDLMDEVGVSNINSVEDLENFYLLCKEIHPDYVGFGRGMNAKVLNGAISSEKNMSFINSFAMTDGNKPDDNTVYSYYESEEFKQVAEITKRWVDMEIIPSYLLANPEQSASEFAIGRAMFAVSANDRIFEMNEMVRNSAPDAVFENFYLGDSQKKPLMQTMGTYTVAFAVSAGVEDPKELAAYAQVINLFQKNQEWVDLWTYGVEGTDYTIDENGRVERITTDEIIHSWMPVNTNFRRYPNYVTDEVIDTFNNQLEGSIESKTMNFIFDTEPVKSEYAQLQAIETEYLSPIANGFMDYDENIEVAIKKMKDAGIDKFMEELQRQFDAFMASK